MRGVFKNARGGGAANKKSNDFYHSLGRIRTQFSNPSFRFLSFVSVALSHSFFSVQLGGGLIDISLATTGEPITASLSWQFLFPFVFRFCRFCFRGDAIGELVPLDDFFAFSQDSRLPLIKGNRIPLERY